MIYLSMEFFPNASKLLSLYLFIKVVKKMVSCNYRLIAMLQKRYMSFILQQGILLPEQFGFLNNNDAMFSLLHVVNSSPTSNPPRPVFCEHAKAFDCVNHKFFFTEWCMSCSCIFIQDFSVRRTFFRITWLASQLQWTLNLEYITKESLQLFSSKYHFFQQSVSKYQYGHK